MLELLIALAIVAGVGLVVGYGAAVVGRRRQRRRSQLLAERLLVEGHMQWLTAQTLQAMRQVVRERLRTDGGVIK